MTGQRIVNDHSFECIKIQGMTLEYLSVFYTYDSKSDVLMLVLKLKELELYQRFFLDAAIGIWEEWNKEDTFYDLDDVECVDLKVKYHLDGRKLSKVYCNGAYEVFSDMVFVFDELKLRLKYSDTNDIESDMVLEKI